MVNPIAVPASLISISTHKAAMGVCNDSSTSHISKTTETSRLRPSGTVGRECENFARGSY